VTPTTPRYVPARRCYRDALADVDALHALELVADHPFDPVDKYVAHVWKGADGRFRVAAKGSLEGILAHASATSQQRQMAHAANDKLASSGMRVLAVAYGESGALGPDRAHDEACLGLVGLVAFSDPVRPGVADALADCRAAGIRSIMITGDHPTTAHAVVEALDLPHTDEAGVDHVGTGDDIERANDAELDELVRTTNVFARTQPAHKHRLVAALRRGGDGCDHHEPQAQGWSVRGSGGRRPPASPSPFGTTSWSEFAKREQVPGNPGALRTKDPVASKPDR
jgi:P-type Ca2+ transporter type 2C